MDNKISTLSFSIVPVNNRNISFTNTQIIWTCGNIMDTTYDVQYATDFII